jgi:uncharacterized protein
LTLKLAIAASATNALLLSRVDITLKEARRDGAFWGRVVESAVGAHLANAAAAGVCDLYYRRDRDREVDFVGRTGQTLTALEVKSSRVREAHSGLGAFADAYHPKRKLLVGGDGIPLEEFLSRPVQYWVRE